MEESSDEDDSDDEEEEEEKPKVRQLVAYHLMVTYHDVLFTYII